jgi:DNA-binding Lrp family transcriptional regulator
LSRQRRRRHDICVDRIDRAIIDQLRRDAHLTNTELADRVGLTPSPCHRRVRRLEDEQIILGYHARIAPEALGRGFEAYVDFELTNQAKETVQRFETELVAFDEVIEARRMFGAPDYQALVAAADLPAYERFMTEHLMALPGLARLQSRFAMKTLKSDPPRADPASHA